MNKIQKAIAKLPKEHREVYNFLIQKLLDRNLAGLNVIKLKGHQDIYRVKQGRLRIIFSFTRGDIEVLDVGLRNDHTYRKF